MPTYEFRCTKPNCGREFETTARMSDPNPTRGPGCSESGCQIEKKLSRVSAFVKGAGAAKDSARVQSQDQALLRTEGGQKPGAAVLTESRGATPHVCTQYCKHHG